MTKIVQINIKTIFQMYFSYHNFHYSVSKINTIYIINCKKIKNKKKKNIIIIVVIIYQSLLSTSLLLRCLGS